MNDVIKPVKPSSIPEKRGMSMELLKEFINDEKYKDVKDYFLSAFKRIDKKTDWILDDNSPFNRDYDKNQDYQRLIDTVEDVGEVACRCVDLLERAYYD